MTYTGPRRRPGQLRYRVTIQRSVPLDDGQGGSIVEWVDHVEKLPADVQPLTGRERMQGDRIAAEAGYLVFIRWRGDIDESMRVVWADRARTMNIRFVEDWGARATYLALQCERGVAT